MTVDTPSAVRTLAAKLNLRDVGGHATADGRQVRTGLVYRSAALLPPDEASRQALAQLRPSTVYDLRTADERTADPDQLPPGAQLVVLDVFGDNADVAPARLKEMLTSGASFEGLLDDGTLAATYEQAYRQLVSLPSACRSYRQMYTELAQDGGGASLFHCTAGKDRTGWAAAALLLRLGVPDDAVRADYLASNAGTQAMFRPQVDAFAAAGGDRAVIEEILRVEPSYLSAALDEVRQHFGDIGGYFSDGLGLTPAVQEKLLQRLLD